MDISRRLFISTSAGIVLTTLAGEVCLGETLPDIPAPGPALGTSFGSRCLGFANREGWRDPEFGWGFKVPKKCLEEAVRKLDGNELPIYFGDLLPPITISGTRPAPTQPPKGRVRTIFLKEIFLMGEIYHLSDDLRKAVQADPPVSFEAVLGVEDAVYEWQVGKLPCYIIKKASLMAVQAMSYKDAMKWDSVVDCEDLTYGGYGGFPVRYPDWRDD